MPDQYAVAQAQRAALLRGDRAVSRVVLDHYFRAWKSIRDRLAVLTRQLEEARERGEGPNRAWLAQQGRLEGLQRHVSQEVSLIAGRLAPFLTGEQAKWAAQAQADTAAQVLAAKGGAGAGTGATGFGRINTVAVENVVGFLSDGSPLHRLLQGLGPDAATAVGDALVQSVIVGRSPRDTATAVRHAFGGNMARAVLVARDAVLGAYRETAHQTYLANRDVCRQWQWLASHTGRTCPSCLAMSGTLHPLTERLRSHPACRCTQIPVLLDTDPPAPQTGRAWFRQQSAAVQRQLVGPRKYAALRAGAITLEDLTIRRRSRRWGSHQGEATYAEALANARSRKAEAA